MFNMNKTINSQTKLTCLLGNPVGHSFSPLIHNTLFKKLELNYRYLAFNVKPVDLEKAVHGLKAIGVVGFNVTIPHKEAIINLLDHVEERAEAVGAVNTVLFKDNQLYGYNTDITGFKKSLIEAGFSPNNKRITVLGAGGAAKAVIKALVEENASEVYVINRNQEKALKIIEEYKKIGVTNIKNIQKREIFEAVQECSLIVNATSIGMKGYLVDESPLPKEYLNSKMWLCDLIYNPLKTRFLRDGEAMGCKIVNGLGMLINQGADAFKIWTGIEPPREVIKDLLLNL